MSVRVIKEDSKVALSVVSYYYYHYYYYYYYYSYYYSPDVILCG